jgi:hypothetical protein
MTIEVSGARMKELEELVDRMNREAELALYHEEGTPEHDKHLQRLLRYKEEVVKLEEHERTFVEQGLLDRKDIHDFYWPELDARDLHQRQKTARLDQEGKIRSDEEWRRS